MKDFKEELKNKVILKIDNNGYTLIRSYLNNDTEISLSFMFFPKYDIKTKEDLEGVEALLLNNNLYVSLEIYEKLKNESNSYKEIINSLTII